MDGGDMDHFMFFCHCEVSRSEWQWHGPFSDLSVTVRSTAADGGGTDQFLVFCHREVCRDGWW